MDHSQCSIAVFDGRYDNTYCEQIVNLIDRLVLVDHLFVDAVEVFYTAVDLGFDSRILYVLTHFIYDVLHILLPHGFAFCDLCGQALVGFRLQIFERQIFKLDLDLGNTEPLGDRCINIDGLSGDILLFLRLHIGQRTHIVQAVGQFDHNDTDILGHRKKHLTQIGRLTLHLIRRILQLGQLGHTIDQQCHIDTEFRRQFLDGHHGIFDHIMQKACRDRFFIHFHIGENDGHTDRMDDIGFSGLAFLVLMKIPCRGIGFLDQRDIVRRMISLHTRDQLPVKILRRLELGNIFDSSVIDHHRNMLIRHIRRTLIRRRCLRCPQDTAA